MSNRQKTAGDRTEREAERILADLLGVAVRRKLGAGRRDDQGDIDLERTTVQVTRCLDERRLSAVAATKAAACETQQARAGTEHGVTLIRATTCIGIVWRAVLTPAQWAALGCPATASQDREPWPAWLTIALCQPTLDGRRWTTVGPLIVTTVHDWAAAWRET